MRLFIALLILAFSVPIAAQEKKAEKTTTEKKADKKADKKAAKKAEKKGEKKEKTQAKAEPKQEWGRFSSNAKQDEAARAKAKDAK